MFKRTICTIAAVIAFGLCLIPAINQTNEGTSASVYLSSNAVKADLKNKYEAMGGVKPGSVSVSKGADKKLNTQNYNQNTLKRYYNNNNGSDNDLPDDGGICWCSAATSLLKFNGITKGKNALSCDLIKHAIKKNWISSSSTGLLTWNHDDLITFGFDDNSINKEGTNDYAGIYDTLKGEVDNGKATLFMIKNHTMTGCGYVTFTVKYKKKNVFGVYTDRVDKKDYVIVNDTWADTSTRQYSYFPKDEIGSGIFTVFGNTKVRSK